MPSCSSITLVIGWNYLLYNLLNDQELYSNKKLESNDEECKLQKERLRI